MNYLIYGVLGTLGLLIAVVIGIISLVVYITVQRLKTPEKYLSLAPAEDNIQQYTEVIVHQEWAQKNKFDWIGGYTFNATANIFMAVWQQQDSASYLCLYCVPNPGILGEFLNYHYDLVTIFSKENSLTSSNSQDALMLPQQPGCYVQSFPADKLDELWERHQKSRDYLIEEKGFRLKQIKKPFEEILITSIKNQMDYVRSLFLWPLRGSYWFFIRRKINKNISVEKQKIESF